MVETYIMDKKIFFRKHLDILYDNCFQGMLHIKVWNDIDKNLTNNLYNRYSLFWLSTLKAQLEAAQLHLLKLFDKSKKSISIYELIKYAEENKDLLFKPGDCKLLVTELNDYSFEIQKYDDQIKNLIDIRNNHFVHLSKKHVTNYDKFYSEYSTIRENINEILQICSEPLYTFKQLGFNESKMMITGTEHQTVDLIRVLNESLND